MRAPMGRKGGEVGVEGRGGIGELVEQASHGRAQALGGPAATWAGVASAGEFVEVLLLVVVEAQGAGQSGQHGCGCPHTALFQSCAASSPTSSTHLTG
jgi:hypothetical protein